MIFRFVGRTGDGLRYIWQRSMPGDSRVEQITCGVEWFWSK